MVINILILVIKFSFVALGELRQCKNERSCVMIIRKIQM